MPIFVIPIIGTFITAGIMMWGLGEPVGALTSSLTQWLQGMQQGSIVMLAVIMGLMLAFDMGGPVNKVAYAFMLICVAQGVYTVVAIAAVAICVPPLGLGLATLLGRKNFSSEEREAGKAALVMGCVGVTEGAIPFAAADPLRVIPSIMLGSACGAVTAALVRRAVLRRLGRVNRVAGGRRKTGVYRCGCGWRTRYCALRERTEKPGAEERLSGR